MLKLPKIVGPLPEDTSDMAMAVACGRLNGAMEEKCMACAEVLLVYAKSGNVFSVGASATAIVACLFGDAHVCERWKEGVE